MIALGVVLVLVGLAVYAAGKRSGEDSRRLAAPDEVERAIRDVTD